MELSNSETHRLLELLAQKVGEYLDDWAFKEIEQMTEGSVTSRFLGDKFRDVKNGQDPITFQSSKIEPLLKAAGFESLTHYRSHLEQPVPEVLKSCLGSWISLVRQNSFDGYLYQSPVSIEQASHQVHFKLRGPSYVYRGEMTYRNGCLTTLFSGDSGKEFHHVYKIGNRKNPAFLQGVYTGISTGDDPIGGRCILYRTEAAFESIENRRLKVADLLASEHEQERALGKYFESFERNNLRLNPIIAFDLEDLRNGW